MAALCLLARVQCRYPCQTGSASLFEAVVIAVVERQLSPLKVDDLLGNCVQEVTIMRVTVEGEEDGSRKAYVYHLYDEYDTETGTSSMARTTGYTCTAAAHLILGGLFTQKGVFPPELVGKHRRCFDYVLAHLAERGVAYRMDEQPGGSES